MTTIDTAFPAPAAFCSRSSTNSSSRSAGSMNPLRRLVGRRSSKTAKEDPSPSAPIPSISSRSNPNNPFAVTQPTRRPRDASSREQPPPYSPPNPTATSLNASTDSPYAFLRTFDTLFLIDDSGSMAGRSWRECAAALSQIAPICTTHDADGIDIYFLNHRNPASATGAYHGVRDSKGVEEIFQVVRPLGGTPTGTRLNHVLKPYLTSLESTQTGNSRVSANSEIKPLNIIVITDGVPSDDVESVILSCARRLDAINAEAWQVGIQFFQVGREPEAAEMLRELDDVLGHSNGVRDMVDTVPWNGESEEGLSGEGLLKVCLGSVVRRWDRKKV